MNLSQKAFDAVVENRISTCYNGLVVKGKEYVRNDDRLHNFRETARRENQTMLEALNGMMAKHVTGYHDLIQDVKSGKKVEQKVIDDRFTDLINYLLLSEAIIVEHNQNS